MTLPKPTLHRMDPPEPEHVTEYAVHAPEGMLRGFVASDGRRWLAYDAGFNLLAEIDIETRAEAVGVVMHPERLGLSPLR